MCLRATYVARRIYRETWKFKAMPVKGASAREARLQFMHIFKCGRKVSSFIEEDKRSHVTYKNLRMNLNSKQGYLTGKSAPDRHSGYLRKVPASIEVGSRATPYPNHGPIALDSGGVEQLHYI